jgi:hypothetical protein
MLKANYRYGFAQSVYIAKEISNGLLVKTTRIIVLN